MSSDIKTLDEFLADNPNVDVSKAWERSWGILSAMKEKIAEALGMDAADIGIKATTNETMGFVGREEGIAALASASIALPDRS